VVARSKTSAVRPTGVVRIAFARHNRLMPTSSTPTVLVTGATGNTGRPLLRFLEGRQVRVRAMVHRNTMPDRLGDSTATIVTADFDDADSLNAALTDVTHAYLVTPSSADAEAQQIRFAECAAAAGVTHLVKLSQFAADEDSPVRFLRYHGRVERRIRELGIGYTFIRPNLYFQGLFGFAELIARTGRFFAPISDARVSAVDVRDIAAVAAIALTEPGHEGQTYTVTGPAALTHAEMAQALGAATKRDVSFVEVPPAQFAAVLQQLGMPLWQIEGLLEDYAHYQRGEASAVTHDVSVVTGADARTFTQFVEDYADAFTRPTPGSPA
jgi:uncharacterized protein YbjT (DUF2867 family)